MVGLCIDGHILHFCFLYLLTLLNIYVQRVITLSYSLHFLPRMENKNIPTKGEMDQDSTKPAYQEVIHQDLPDIEKGNGYGERVLPVLRLTQKL